MANQSKKCAMCRHEIPADYFEKPVLVAQNNTEKDIAELDDGYQWFYEGRNGKFFIFLFFCTLLWRRSTPTCKKL